MAADRRHLRLEGVLAGPWLTELQRICAELKQAGVALALDLSSVTFADVEAVRWLEFEERLGTRLLKGTGFIAERLGSRPNDE